MWMWMRVQMWMQIGLDIRINELWN